MEESIEFKGRFMAKKPVFSSDSFKIYRIVAQDKDKANLKLDQYGTVTIVGDIPDLDHDIEYTINGILKSSPKFGYQYQITKIHRDKPISAKDIKKFLHEVLTSKQADSLLAVYPNIIDMVIKGEEVDLSLTKGVKEKTFEKIKRKIIKNYALLDLVSEYSDYGLTLTMLRKLYEVYTSIERIREKMKSDPYGCLCAINGIGFKSADEKILKMRPEMLKSKQRMEACIIYILDDNESKGSTAIKKQVLFSNCSELAPEPMNFLVEVLGDTKFIVEGDLVAKRSTYETELYIANKLMKMMHTNDVLDINHKNYCNIGSLDLTEEQGNSLSNLCKYKVSILAGFAGSGKTQTTKAVIDMCEHNNLSYVLYAPTGRASQVMAEYCEREASTIHRGLGFNPETGFEYNEENPLDVDIVVADESSMVDVFLMRNLLESIDINRTRILFICDPKQLPSVGAGNICYDMIQSLKIPTTTLTRIFRYGEGGLMQVATKIRNGENYVNYGAVGINNYGTNSDYSMIIVEQEKTIGWIQDILKSLLSQGNALKDMIVLTSMNKGDYGTIAVNKSIQELINPPSEIKAETKFGQTTFRVGDRVMQTRNNYHAKDSDFEETTIFNGNIGTVKVIDGKDVLVEYDDRSIWYEHEELENLTLGYCITIHKSQGSAFDHVILITPKAHTFFLNKNLLYVGVTRAKKRLFHITTPEVIISSLKKEIIYIRDTFLKGMMKKYVKGSENLPKPIKAKVKEIKVVEKIEKAVELKILIPSFAELFG